MIDFACRQFDLDDIIKCGLGLTKAGYKVMTYFLSKPDSSLTTESISKSVNLNLSTVQKAVKRLSDQNIIIKHQKNLSSGGYVFIYSLNSRKGIKEILKKIIRNWAERVEQQIDIW